MRFSDAVKRHRAHGGDLGQCDALRCSCGNEPHLNGFHTVHRIGDGRWVVADPAGGPRAGPAKRPSYSEPHFDRAGVSTQPLGFGLEYQAAEGTRQQPVMIHSAKFGSIERFIGVLTEHYAGAFPAWLAPVVILVVALAYVWSKGDLEWVRAEDRS